MNTNNLIRLGAMAQKKFNMQDNFRLMTVPDVGAATHDIIYKIPEASGFFPPDFETEIVHLERFVLSDDHESVFAGYSERANTLVIMESLK